MCGEGNKCHREEETFQQDSSRKSLTEGVACEHDEQLSEEEGMD